MAPTSWTRENVRHAASLFRYDRHPAATVYDSLGDDFFLALAPGWLNLGLWEGDGPIRMKRRSPCADWWNAWRANSRPAATCSTSATASPSRTR